MSGTGKKLAKVGVVGTPAVVALALVAMQFVFLGLIQDIIASVAIFGLGYLAGYLRKG